MLGHNTSNTSPSATATINTPTLSDAHEVRPTSRWSAPVPTWVLTATDHRGRLLRAAAVVLLTYLWSRADAPSKRPEGGATFLRAAWRVDNGSIARDLGRNIRNIERQFAVLAQAGLVFRGECVIEGRVESGIWLADLEQARFVQPEAPGEDAGPDEFAGHSSTGEDAGSETASSPGDSDAQTGEFAELYKDARFNPDPDPIPDSDHDHKIADHAPVDESPPRTAESSRRRGGRVGMSQIGLFADEVTRPQTPDRDPAMEVFEYLRDRICTTKVELGIKPAIGPRVLGKAERRNIEERIREHGKRPDGSIDVDAGVEACKRVIDVDEADSVRVREISQYWNATTPFRNTANFEGRLMRWRESGEHQVWGSKAKAKGPKPRTDHGFDAYMPEDDFVDELGQQCMGKRTILEILEKRYA